MKGNRTNHPTRGKVLRGVGSELTDRQREVLSVIAESVRERGFPPTFREMGARLGIISTNAVSDQLRALERKGVLVRDEAEARAMRITDLGYRVLGGERAHEAAVGTGAVDPRAASIALARWVSDATPEQAAAIVRCARQVLGLRLSKTAEAA